MQKIGRIIVAFLIISVFAGLWRIQYLEKKGLAIEIGTSYQKAIENYDSNFGKWITSFENNEMSAEAINKIQALDNVSYPGDVLPVQVIDIKLCLSDLQDKIIKNIDVKKDLKTGENKRLILLLNKNITALHEGVESVEDNCKNDPYEFFKQLRDSNSKAVRKLQDYIEPCIRSLRGM